MVASAEQLHHKDTKTRSNWCPIGKSVSSWKSVDVYNLHGSVATDQRYRNSGDLFINHYSLITERRVVSWCLRGENRVLSIDHWSLVMERSADAFGIRIAGAGTTPNQILYSGEYLDPGTGNYDLRARVYNENTGTFLTRDTYAGQNGDPITLHQYLYAGADPIMNFDPTGDYTQNFGYAAEAAIRGVYVANHLGDRIGTGGWTRFGTEGGSSHRLKPDILNRTTLKFAEIKPFNLSGIIDGIAQLAKYTLSLGPFGYTPDVNWIPIPPITTVSGKPLFFANFGGLVLYTNADEALRLMLTISVLGASGQFLSDNAQFLRNLLGQAGGSPELVNAAEVAPTLSLETDVMTATLTEEI